MRPRTVKPEILDHLAAGDPAAVRSRRDLRLINSLMGNDRWIVKQARRFPAALARGITEIGAGEGMLARKLAAEFSDAQITALDLAPPPENLPRNLRWVSGDVFAADLVPEGGVLIANLFLHHFEGAALRRIGEICASFDVLVFSEPLRAGFPHLAGALLHPFVNHVTRHDMRVSIDAGFRCGELPAWLEIPHRKILEESTFRGAQRVVAYRD